MVCALIFLGIFIKDKELHSQKGDITKYLKTSCIEHVQKVGNRSSVSANRIITVLPVNGSKRRVTVP